MGQQPHFIREWRKFRGLTQEQFAERIGIHRAHLSKIETGAREYDQSFLEAAALELRTTPAELLIRRPGDLESILVEVSTTTPSQQAQIVQMIKVIKGTGTNG